MQDGVKNVLGGGFYEVNRTRWNSLNNSVNVTSNNVHIYIETFKKNLNGPYGALSVHLNWLQPFYIFQTSTLKKKVSQPVWRLSKLHKVHSLQTSTLMSGGEV